MSLVNPDPKRYVLRARKGKFILVDRQILRWRKARRKAKKAQEALQAKLEAASTPPIRNIFE